MKFQNLPSILPLHIADGTILLPRAQLPLLLKSQKDKITADYALKEGHRMMGVIQINPEGGFFKTGCMGKIISFQEGPFLYITLKGICRFDISEIIDDDSLKKAKVTYNEYKIDLEETQTDPFVDRTRLLNLLGNYLEDQEIFANWDEINHASDELIISSLSMACPFKPIEKQALLESSSLSERCDIMMALMEIASPHFKGESPVLH
ncbi:MAG: LON peptidase substrate-binding domain-containing protein [Alphaproteobacteria bacterium]|nr:LON peptidase substrate-binding domain-containing protein [Alphaproteobacteria bacterium]